MLWQTHAQCRPLTQTALRTSQGVLFTWVELCEQIDNVAKILANESIGQDYALALYGKNSETLLFYYLAALQLGARVLCLNPTLGIERAKALCLQHQISYLIDLNEKECCYHFEQPALPQSQGMTMTLTSGSSGTPKAVLHHIDAHLANAKGVCQLMTVNQHSKWLLSLPLYHVSGQGIVWRWLLSGCQLQLSSDDFYADLCQVTHASLVSTQLQRFYRYLETTKKFYQIKHILLGGSYISRKLTQPLSSLGIQGYVGYGMTEMASTIFAKKCDEHSSVGRALLGRECCIHNGEIWLRGAGIGLGYWRDKQIHSLVNQDGWLATKDRGQLIDGELFIYGRADNMFISGGENIQPEEIESLLLQSDLLEQAFVLPIDDAEFGQRPVALVKFKEHFTQTTVKNLRVFLLDKIERFKQPIAYYPLHIEMQGNIKISRNQVKAQLAQILKE
ncbi:MAG: o-succinylbenzoate--CoA ligase [Pasteurellaceae bacterium]|nr:o-succinylbenzoate--CoA ligase [Pasteurellaceae bacterium]